MSTKDMHPAQRAVSGRRHSSRRDEYGLTPVSYALLGALATKGPRTPYQLKKLVAETLGYFWSFSHGNIYSEPVRLVEAGLVTEDQENESRRRRVLSITADGHKAIERWIGEPTDTPREIRDIGMMKLFFSEVVGREEIVSLIDQQIAVHQNMLDLFSEAKSLFATRENLGNRPVTIEMGLRYERAAIDFWTSLQVGEDGKLTVALD